MSNKGQLLQDPFLNLLRKEHVPVSIYLVNGIKLQGHIESFDQYVVLLRNTVTQMVYKHAISTVVPGRAVNFHASRSRRAGLTPLAARRARGAVLSPRPVGDAGGTRRARGPGRRRLRRRLGLRRDARRTGAAGRSRPATSRWRASSRGARRPTRRSSSARARPTRSRRWSQATGAAGRDLRPGAVAGAAAQPRAPPRRARWPTARC